MLLAAKVSVNTNDTLSGFLHRLISDGYRLGVVCVFTALIFFLLWRAKINKVVAVIESLGLFWLSWVMYNTVASVLSSHYKPQPLFTGSITVNNLWDIFFAGGGSFFVGCIGIIVALGVWIFSGERGDRMGGFTRLIATVSTFAAVTLFWVLWQSFIHFSA